MPNTPIENDLKFQILKLIDNGVVNFYVGTHGDFDKLVLQNLIFIKKNINKNINIFVVLTSLTILKNKNNYYSEYFKYIIFDIENIYFKNIISFSNKKMIEKCEYLICYINKNNKYSRAKIYFNFAKKNNKKIINLFH